MCDCTGGITGTGLPKTASRTSGTTTYTRKELEPWAGRVRAISERTRSTYVVTNNHFEGKAVVNALQLAALLNDNPVKIPEPLMAWYPELKLQS
jgi:uncharacterized protein YecE (DUF72 family)